jgi:amino acid adenylation domain-containing protein
MLVNLDEQGEVFAPANAAASASHSPALASAQWQQLLIEFNQSAASYPRQICLHQLFEAQVKRTPDAPALIFGDQHITYRALNARANQVAHRLQKLGVKPETLVGLCMERSPEMVIAMYGILKAGGAYVPFDPSYPRERLAFMLADTNVAVLLTQASLKANLEQLSTNTPQMICLDTEEASLAAENDANLESGVTEENLAYVIYTSGSTGQPKGVMTEHRGICNQLQWMQEQYPLTPENATLLKTPFSFDYSLYEFFSPLLAGAKLVIANPQGQKDAAYLIELMQQTRVTTLFMVPSHLQMLLEQPGFAACVSLQRIFCSGEALPFALQQRFFAQMPAHIMLHNLYGPTEASIECTFWDCERNSERKFVPVGRPMSNYQIHILDEKQQPVPPGTPGELHISGIGLARGYWNRPELTAEKFIQLTVHSSQFTVPSTVNSLRLYRTGDLARWHTDGVIECLGRIDFQVKIRGHRIELGEIEAALCAHPAVRESVVVAREDVPGDKRLVAYYVTTQMATVTTLELREFLKHKLPDYMLPSAFVRLEAFPLSPNGKIERRQLPAPNEAPSERQTDFVAPSNEWEQKLASLWEQTLGIVPISVTDNFFDLGGHSMLAVRIFAAIEKEWGYKLPLATLFHAPTIRQLAGKLRQQGWQPSWSSLVPLQPRGSKPPFFCVHAVGGNVLEYYDLARYLSPDQPFYGLQAVGLDGQQAPLTSIEQLAAHYLQELRRVQPTGPYYLGGRSFGGVVAYEMAQQLHHQGEEVALVALLDTDPLGWMKLLPRRLALQQQTHFLALRIRRHLANLHSLSLRGKCAYMQDKVSYKKRKLATWHWQLKRAFNASNTTHLADALREVEEVNYQAQRQYIPRPYPGRVTFFSAREEVSSLENQCGWQSLAQGGVKIIEVPGNHQTMIKPPNVQGLAQQLTACLTRNEP